MEKISFVSKEDGSQKELYVLEQTTLGGNTYILVTESENDDGMAMILKDISKEDSSEAEYEEVTDSRELDAVADVFQSLLDDVDIELK